MIKILIFFFATVFGSPFTGSPSEERHILREGGGVAIRMDPHPAPFNKNAHMIDRSVNRKSSDHLPIVNRLKTMLFGKEESVIRFESTIDELVTLKKARTLMLNKKLG